MLTKVAMAHSVADRAGSEIIGNADNGGGGSSVRLSPLNVSSARSTPAHHLVSGGSSKEEKDESQGMHSSARLSPGTKARRMLKQTSSLVPDFVVSGLAAEEQIGEAKGSHLNVMEARMSKSQNGGSSGSSLKSGTYTSRVSRAMHGNRTW